MWEKVCENCGWRNCGSKAYCSICSEPLQIDESDESPQGYKAAESAGNKPVRV